MRADARATPYDFDAEPRQMPPVLVRGTRRGWEVLRCYVNSEGKPVQRSVDLFTTEQLAQRAAAQLLTKIQRIRMSAIGSDQVIE